jgi:hypothetical protein
MLFTFYAFLSILTLYTALSTLFTLAAASNVSRTNAEPIAFEVPSRLANFLITKLFSAHILYISLASSKFSSSFSSIVELVILVSKFRYEAYSALFSSI